MELDNQALLAAAAKGDQAAWDTLVRAYSNLLWSIARSFRLQDALAAEAVQTAWLRLVENLDRIVEPERVGSWLATTVRRECLMVIRRSARGGVAVPEDVLAEVVDTGPAVDDGLLRQERNTVLWRALARLGERCQQLLRVLMASPPPSYHEVAAALDMPVGSIGPTRQRCLGQLRGILAGDPVVDPRLPDRGRS